MLKINKLNANLFYKIMEIHYVYMMQLIKYVKGKFVQITKKQQMMIVKMYYKTPFVKQIKLNVLVHIQVVVSIMQLIV